jgi:UDP-glucose 4-epimerase
MTDYGTFYSGRKVMVTGGLGFIGSNLVRQLVDAGADVLIVDSLFPDYGGNRFNIAGLEARVSVNVADVRDDAAMEALVRGREIIFNLAGQVSHIDSMRDPHTDLEINCRAQLSMLEACRKFNPAVRVVYAGTRQVYGRPDRLPVDETHLVRPADINGVNKAAGEYYHLLYNNVFGVRACSLRLTNVYGPRQLIRHNRQGFIGWFIRLAIEGKEIQVFGDGSQLRDFVYVDDAADAFLRAGASDACDGEVFNVGGDEPISHKDLVTLLLDVAGSGSVRYVEWPEEKKRIDIGSFYTDSSKFRRAVGWQPRVDLRTGLERTIAFYRAHLHEYTREATRLEGAAR